MYTITEATLADVQTISNLAEATWWPTYSGVISDGQIRFMLDSIYNTQTLTGQIQNREQTFLLLKQHDRAVAFAGYSVYDQHPSSYKLQKLYCLPETQGKGYGKILINKVARLASLAGAHKLYLNVNRYNTALNFYQKMGFVVDHEVDIPFGPFVLNDYVMVKELASESSPL